MVDMCLSSPIIPFQAQQVGRTCKRTWSELKYIKEIEVLALKQGIVHLLKKNLEISYLSPKVRWAAVV